jgi:hypothetical protein
LPARVFAATNLEHGKNKCYVVLIPTILSQRETTISLNFFNTKIRDIINRSCFQEVCTSPVVLHKTIQAIYVTDNVTLRCVILTVVSLEKQ